MLFDDIPRREGIVVPPHKVVKVIPNMIGPSHTFENLSPISGVDVLAIPLMV